MERVGTEPIFEVDNMARDGYAAGMFAAKHLVPPDRATVCPKCKQAMHRKHYGVTLYGFSCADCLIVMFAEAGDCIEAAEKLGVLA